MEAAPRPGPAVAGASNGRQQEEGRRETKAAARVAVVRVAGCGTVPFRNPLKEGEISWW